MGRFYGTVSFTDVSVDVELRADECMEQMLEDVEAETLLDMIEEYDQESMAAWIRKRTEFEVVDSSMERLLENFSVGDIVDELFIQGPIEEVVKNVVRRLTNRYTAADLMRLCGVAMKVDYREDEELPKVSVKGGKE